MSGFTEMDLYYVLTGMAVIFILVIFSFILNIDE